MISDFRRDLNIVYFLLGISPASNYSWPTFWNPVSVPSSKAGCTVHPAFEDGTDTGFRNVGQLYLDAGEIPRRKYTINYFNFLFYIFQKSDLKKTLAYFVIYRTSVAHKTT